MITMTKGREWEAWEQVSVARQPDGTVAFATSDRRHHMIRELIATHPIRTQGELLGHLRQQGMQVSQMTLSRDLQVLHIVKARDLDGRTRYGQGQITQGSDRMFMAERLVVIATSDPNRVAEALVQANLPGLVDVLVGKRGIWVAATAEGLTRVKRWLKREESSR